MRAKKILLVGLLGAISLNLIACGSAMENIKQESTQVEQEASKEETEKNTSSSKVENEENKETKEEADINKTTEVEVEVTFEEIADEVFAEDETEIFGYYYCFPVVNVVGNEAATKAIAEDIEKKKNSVLEENKNMESSAREYYEETKGQEDIIRYIDSLSYWVNYQNDEIISIMYDQWTCSAENQELSMQAAVNYSLKTGERLTFENFFKDKEMAVEQIEAYILKLCESPYYEGVLLEEYRANIKDIVKEDFWYFEKDGMHFVVNQYEMSPYAEAIIDFVIPYEEMPEMKQEYIAQSVFVYPVIQGTTMEMDMDSDGTKESVCYSLKKEKGEVYIDEEGTEYETSGAVEASIVINGQEYSHLLKELEVYYAESPDEYYYFVDLDKSDSYIELAVIDYGVNDNWYTYFLRYDKGEVTCLGYIPDALFSDNCNVNGDGTITARIYSSLLETTRLEGTFKLENGKMQEVKKDWYEKDENPHEVLKSVTVYTENSTDSDTKILTSEDGPISFLATDNEEWVKLKTKDGSIYYLHMTDFTEIDSAETTEEATEVFADLMLAG